MGRHGAEEMADAQGRFEDAAAGKTEPVQGFPDEAGDRREGVESVEG